MKKKKKKNYNYPLYKRWWFWIIIVVIAIGIVGGGDGSDETEQPVIEDTAQIEAQVEGPTSDESPPEQSENSNDATTNITVPKGYDKSLFEGYRIITVDGGDLSGKRESNVAVDIGFGDREYWAFTNEYGQLVRVVAKQIILQDDSTEPVNSNGRYYNDEAKVPGTERADLDEGHVIADSLGGVSNAYNITPQNSTLNRHGDQAYMEKVIRDAGGCTDFEAIITYPNTKTQIPNKYKYTYTINGNVIIDEFENVDSDKANKALIESQKQNNATSNTPNTSSNTPNASSSTPASSGSHDLAAVDTNGDGKVTIKEAKAAGFKMPITKDHWLYQYMDDRDGDGMVGE